MCVECRCGLSAKKGFKEKSQSAEISGGLNPPLVWVECGEHCALHDVIPQTIYCF